MASSPKHPPESFTVIPPKRDPIRLTLDLSSFEPMRRRFWMPEPKKRHLKAVK